MGRTGETYAFDRRGTLISQSRFEDQLRTAGLLDSNPLVTSPLNIEVRDPGVNLTLGETTSVRRDLQPLTLMADQATRGGTGDNISGLQRLSRSAGCWRVAVGCRNMVLASLPRWTFLKPTGRCSYCDRHSSSSYR